MMKKMLAAAIAATVLVVAPVAMTSDEGEEIKASDKRGKIDEKAQATMDDLFAKNAKAKELYDTAHGWAAFGNWKFALGVSGGGGDGVAVDRETGKRTYMKMGTVGVGLGLGGKKYQVIFLFQDAKTFNNFVDKGWQADTSASAAAGTASATAGAGFVNGIAIYQITDSGLMAAADIAGTKYWKNKKLNDED